MLMDVRLATSKGSAIPGHGGNDEHFRDSYR